MSSGSKAFLPCMYELGHILGIFTRIVARENSCSATVGTEWHPVITYSGPHTPCKLADRSPLPHHPRDIPLESLCAKRVGGYIYIKVILTLTLMALTHAARDLGVAAMGICMRMGMEDAWETKARGEWSRVEQPALPA